MPISDAQKRANKKSDEKYWEYCTVKVRKGQKAEIKAAADADGQSINGYITQAVEERMAKEKPPQQCDSSGDAGNAARRAYNWYG